MTKLCECGCEANGDNTDNPTENAADTNREPDPPETLQ